MTFVWWSLHRWTLSVTLIIEEFDFRHFDCELLPLGQCIHVLCDTRNETEELFSYFPCTWIKLFYVSCRSGFCCCFLPQIY